MPTAVQPDLQFSARLDEPFHPALVRLDSGEALPGVHLTQSAKRLYARFTRQQLAAQALDAELERGRVGGQVGGQ